MKPSDLKFEAALTGGEAIALVHALDAALDAMVYYGSEQKHMVTLSVLKLTAMQAHVAAFKRERASK